MRPSPTTSPVPLRLYIDHAQARQLQKMSQLLDTHPELEQMVRDDLIRGLVAPEQGRDGMSARQVLRVLVLKQLTQLSYPDLAFYLADSVTCCLFCGFDRPTQVRRKSALADNLSRVRAQTLEQINQVVLQVGAEWGVEAGEKTRTDCTVVEVTAHAPTDSMLLWDGVRRLTLQLNHAATAGYRIPYGDRMAEAKRKALAVHNAANDELRLPVYEQLLELAGATVAEAHLGALVLEGFPDDARAQRWAITLRVEAELTTRVMDQTRRRVLEGKKVPARHKVLSLVEPHTDVIVKDRRQSYFGHKVCLTFGASGMVLGCQVLEGNPADVTLAIPMMKGHQKVYSKAPEQAAFDGAFTSKPNLDRLKEMGVKQVAFSKRRGIPIWQMCDSEEIYEALRRFRAGGEGWISFLKRVVGMRRCSWKGRGGFVAYIWSSVLAANLLTLARALL